MATSKAPDGAAGVRAWLAGIKRPEHRKVLARVDALIAQHLPHVVRAIKWRKPSQPLGVPFYGVRGQGWLMALWSFKDCVAVGFIPGTLLEPPPPSTKMAGTWNRGNVKARRLDLATGEALDEAQFVEWLAQLRAGLPGFGTIEPDAPVKRPARRRRPRAGVLTRRGPPLGRSSRPRAR